MQLGRPAVVRLILHTTPRGKTTLRLKVGRGRVIDVLEGRGCVQIGRADRRGFPLHITQWPSSQDLGFGVGNGVALPCPRSQAKLTVLA